MARRWYELATALKSFGSQTKAAVEELVGKKVSRALLCTLRKVAKYPEHLGRLLDDIGAPISLHRWIAHARPDARDERARQGIADFLERKQRRAPDKLAQTLFEDYFPILPVKTPVKAPAKMPLARIAPMKGPEFVRKQIARTRWMVPVFAAA